MKKLLQKIDRVIIQNIIQIHLYTMLITLLTTSLKVFKLVDYSWNAAFSPALIILIYSGIILIISSFFNKKQIGKTQ